MRCAGRIVRVMRNKLRVVDNAVALLGGRNIGNQYFQIDPDSQFADDDVFAAGEIAQRLSKTFDESWNSELAIPASALPRAELGCQRFIQELQRPTEPARGEHTHEL